MHLKMAHPLRGHHKFQRKGSLNKDFLTNSRRRDAQTDDANVVPPADVRIIIVMRDNFIRRKRNAFCGIPPIGPREDDGRGGRLVVGVLAAMSRRQNPPFADQRSSASPTRNRGVKFDVDLMRKFAVFGRVSADYSRIGGVSAGG